MCECIVTSACWVLCYVLVVVFGRYMCLVDCVVHLHMVDMYMLLCMYGEKPFGILCIPCVNVLCGIDMRG